MSLPSIDADRPVNYPGIVNVVAYGPHLYSGSAPEGATGFHTLQSLGFRTVISVDGQLPDVAAARQFGLRYVHLPIGYNGMDEKRTLEIARAVRDLPGPIYIHCHHGKHRSAAAAGAAAVTLGASTPDAALARMHVSGTAPNYTGLFACVRLARAVGEAELAAAPNDFPSQWRTASTVQRMVEIDETFDRLKAIQAAGWKTPPDHPDIVPVSEAAQLADHFRTLDDLAGFRAKPAAFQEHLETAARETQQLEADLGTPGVDAAALTARLKIIGANCVSCHHDFRD
ncbi:MAG: hypothetical protein WC718_18365 [Phycisphaerales bacterium]|jgi:protein tyrosine phosphatase (PTP) superfamily phosphohydrolase (DUF442 family)